MAELTVPGRVLGGRYRLEEVLARGGMAAVWVAEDPLLSRRVAVKILRPELAADEALRVRFHHEAIAAARLTHPNIVATYDTGDDDGIAYIVMELVDGPTIRTLLRERGALPVEAVVRIGAQVADALDAAHRAGIVHRDVKPANVLVPPVGPVKVTDFGIAKAAGDTDLTRTGTVMGTARYLAPEQVNGRPTDARTDVYALGLLLYEMLCAEPPFGGDTDIATAMARLTSTAPAVRATRHDVPAALDDIVHRCLARNPAARYPSAGAARDALESVLESTGSEPLRRPTSGLGAAAAARVQPHTEARRASAGPPREHVTAPTLGAPLARRRQAWLWVLAAAIVVVAVAVAIYLATRSGGGSGTPPTTVAGAPAHGFSIIAAKDFDPLGDGQEDPQEVPNVHDGDTSTSWSTEMYVDFQRDKQGVGVWVQLDRVHAIGSVTVTTVQSGWSGAIYVADQPGSQLAGWGAVRASGANLGTTKTFTLHDVRGQYVLLWLTKLPGDVGNQRLQVSEVQVA